MLGQDRSPLIDLILLVGVAAVALGLGVAAWVYVLRPLLWSWRRRRR